MRRFLTALAFLCASCAFFAPSASAANFCQTKAGGNWSAAATWMTCGGGTPATGDGVAIGTHSVTLDVDVSLSSITIRNAGVLTVTTNTITLTATTGPL